MHRSESVARRTAKDGASIGVDTGGTFTDLVLVSSGEIRAAKLVSTPADPAAAVVRGIQELGGARVAHRVVHGTTVALNALLSGQVARTALVVNAGFRDLIEIGRQDRPDLYALHPEKPRAIVPRELRFEIEQRSWPGDDGQLQEVRRPSSGEIRKLCERLRRAGPESIAICLLHSYADPEIESRLERALRTLAVPITTSAALLREHREFERFSTAVVNAALVPRMRGYLGGLEERLSGARLVLLQSNGGTLPAADAAHEPVRVLFSGPAGGVVGAARSARDAGFQRLVSLDMGGTSTDVAFHDGKARSPVAAGPAHIAGHPVAVPSLDIHTIGCGGGSLVRVDAGGVLHVGPESAGADPGPICYGRGVDLTITDAHVVLGHIAQGTFLAGNLELDVDRARRAFSKLARRLSTRPEKAAQAVLDVARAAMRRAVGVMTMQRGEDPQGLLLVAFGGAGGLHAAALAESLGMRRFLLPMMSGLLSAYGMATAGAIRERSLSVLAPLSRWSVPRRRRALAELARSAQRDLLADGVAPGRIDLQLELDLRYQGQSFEIRVPDVRFLEAEFHRRHAKLYGYRLPDHPLEIVNLRVRATLRARWKRRQQPRTRALPRREAAGAREVWFDRPTTVPVFERSKLSPGHWFPGPAVVEEYSATAIIPPKWKARVTAGGHLLVGR